LTFFGHEIIGKIVIIWSIWGKKTLENSQK